VPNTTIFPHSAICLLEMDDGSGGGGRGTGFYIGRNRILTCAHNLHGMASVTIIPGKNGNGGASTEPFGRTMVGSASWRIPASYAGSNKATDLAVIDNVPIDAPNGQWFDTLEELNQSRPEGVVVCGYSSRSTKVPELTAAIDGFKQHLHAGYIATLAADNSTFSYPILTLKRASGSPVYYISNQSGQPHSYVVGVHTGADTDDLNRGCRLMQNKIDWIEGRTTSLSLGAGSHSLGTDGPSDHAVHLIPQPNKDACWAASMAMLLAHRGQQSRTPEAIVNEVGGSLASSYSWDLLKAVRDRYGFVMIDQPSNVSIYHSSKQWAEWLNTYGPLWVVIVGAPHAVVVAGIRGNLDDANAAQVKILNPWDTRIAFDNDPIEFRPPNPGYEDWLPFADFAADFGNMSQPDYGNWRILHLPANAVGAQSLSVRGNGGMRLASPPPPVRALNLDATGARREPIEPSRVLGVRMSRVIGEAGGSRWVLDQLEGLKSPATLSPSASSAAPTDVRIDINDWPAIDGAPTPLPLKIEFRAANGSLGDVRITAGMPANLAYGVEVSAKIEDGGDADGVARLRIRIDYRFRGLSQGNADAVIALTLRGDGRYERENGWRDANVEKPDVDKYAALSPAA
jgi:V8-like Glu-specific endopeptidase